MYWQRDQSLIGNAHYKIWHKLCQWYLVAWEPHGCDYRGHLDGTPLQGGPSIWPYLAGSPKLLQWQENLDWKRSTVVKVQSFPIEWSGPPLLAIWMARENGLGVLPCRNGWVPFGQPLLGLDCMGVVEWLVAPSYTFPGHPLSRHYWSCLLIMATYSLQNETWLF